MVQLKEIINSIFNSKSYLVQYEQSHVYLIDCGDIEPIVKWCKENEKVIKGVFITHLSSTYKCNFLGADNKQ